MQNEENQQPQRIGVLALQGDFEAHIHALESLNDARVTAREVRTPDDLRAVDGLILPGGESTTIGKLMARAGLDTAIQEAHRAGKPIFGTCAGMILLAKEIASGGERGGQSLLGLMDIAVARNAFGRQVDSFETDIAAPDVSATPLRGVFIRAPFVASVGADVQVMARFLEKTVLVQQGETLLAAAFHPELTDDTRLHRYFVSLVARSTARNYGNENSLVKDVKQESGAL